MKKKLGIAGLVAALCLSLLSTLGLAETYEARGPTEGGGTVSVVLYPDENCGKELKKYVANLPKRATWDEEKGNKKVHFEGCFGVYGPIVGIYFEDKTFVVLPKQAFQARTEI